VRTGRKWLAAVCAAAIAGTAAAAGPDCFTVVVGSAASATGAVMLAHNEDDRPPQILDLHAVPRLQHEPGELIRLQGGGTVEQVEETAAFVWFELAGQTFADCFLNEHGVTVVSNQCQSRVEDADLTDGGIRYRLRRIVAERAHTALEGVRIAARLVERFGYGDSGRTYTIADPHEAWMLAVTLGRHWVAARIPDDEVAVLANTFTIGEVDLSDPGRFLGSADLVAYARRNGWYDPSRDGAFHFARAYADRSAGVGLHSLPRWWFGVAFLSGTAPGMRNLPFSFRPAHPVRLTDLFALLRSHFEGTQFESLSTYDRGNPHRNAIKRICSESTELGLVAELRSGLPPALGPVAWFAPRRPCVEPFVPVYAGVTAFPDGYAHRPWHQALRDHLGDDPGGYPPDAGHAWWAFAARARRIDAGFARLFPAVRTERDLFQGRVLQARETFEATAIPLAERDPAAGARAVTAFTGEWLERLWNAARAPLPRPVPDGSGRIEPLVRATGQPEPATLEGSR